MRRILYLITLGSWLFSPLAIGLSQIAGISNSKEVLVYLLVVATQAPFLLLLNEALAPAFVKWNGHFTQSLIPVGIILASLFLTTLVTLQRVSFFEISLNEAFIGSITSVASVFTSYVSAIRLLNGIVRDTRSRVNSVLLIIVGSLPNAAVFFVFVFYVSITKSLTDYTLALLIPALLIPNFLQLLIITTFLSKSQPKLLSRDSGIFVRKRSVYYVLFSCMILNLTVSWSNHLRENVAKGDQIGWILLATNMVFTAFLIAMKSNFMENDQPSAKGKSTIWLSMYIILILFATMTVALKLIIFQDIALLFISFLITINVISAFRLMISGHIQSPHPGRINDT